MPANCAPSSERRSEPPRRSRAMKRFAALYRALDTSTGTNDKRAALAAYFSSAPPLDAAWALLFLSGGKLARIANSQELRLWISEQSGLPLWLVEDSYDHVGDLAETASLLVAEPGADAPTRREVVTQAWASLPEDERLLFNKLITGSLRVGVSQRLVQQALSE